MWSGGRALSGLIMPSYSFPGLVLSRLASLGLIALCFVLSGLLCHGSKLVFPDSALVQSFAVDWAQTRN